MPAFLYILILLIIACGPQKSAKKSSDPSPADQKAAKQTAQPDPAPKTSPTTPPPDGNAVPPGTSPTEAGTRQTPEPKHSVIQYLLLQITGSYEFPLDVHQNWMNFWVTFAAEDAPIKLNLVQNFRPKIEQLLIEVTSTGRPFGKFCVVQSDFFEPEQGSITAGQSFSNEGGIVDINNVKDTIKWNSDELPTTFTLEFYGDHGSESVKLTASEVSSSMSENFTHNFDLLCQSCGFEIGQEGLCQVKSSI